MPGNPPVTALRPEVDADGTFLRELHARTRQDEMDATGWPAATQAAFVGMQFNAQQQGYRRAFPHAEFSIITIDDKAVGRIVVNRAQDEIRLVDMAVLPAHRGRGIGTELIQELLREAATAGKPVRLSVIKGQRAFRLYQRLGFRKTGEDITRDQMEWRDE